ncbi:MAG: hypothetical protein QOD93_4867, partial [Acetobacteraceae bacterium]|nr:hypothetical protein [Acetobacteraceae bacterium]
MTSYFRRLCLAFVALLLVVAVRP